MDPWYYLDLDTKGSDDFELSDISDVYPDGSWRLDSGESDGSIIFREEEYDSIEFNNDTKIFKCTAGAKILKFKIVIYTC
jgi:hypothetical protein